MNGYYPLRIMVSDGKGAGTFTDLWQKIEKGEQTIIVTLEGVEITLPDVYEAIPLGNKLHFAPGVPNDPAKFVPAPLEEFQAAIAFGPASDEYKAFLVKEQARLAAFPQAAVDVAADVKVG